MHFAVRIYWSSLKVVITAAYLTLDWRNVPYVFVVIRYLINFYTFHVFLNFKDFNH